ncbi:MAG TPA: YdeI/OmpD-associated family protein [Candidatus Dormibacteraeota bacterium]|nr:YdeI/OmpD-associated family protein [Candidatus Dormibacteraeota bacterium]
MGAKDSLDLDELVVRDAVAWRRWLVGNHAKTNGVWLVLAKKGNLRPTRLTYQDALVEALAHGWIDGQARPRDEATYRQRFTPRRKQSRWSKRNTEIAERLISEGRMHAAGLAEIERAKSDGRWDAAYSGPKSIQVPDDLRAALEADPVANAAFGNLSALNRYAILYRTQDAKRPETRARRISNFVAMLAAGETPYPQRKKL